jgi:hypothetical protein
LQSSGATKSYTYWNSSAPRTNDKITGSAGKPGRGLNTTFLSRASEKVAGEAVGENSGWKIKLVVFVGGTCGSVHVQTFNNNLKELGVLESMMMPFNCSYRNKNEPSAIYPSFGYSKRHMIRRGLVHELLYAQDTVLCSYFAQRSGARGEGWSRDSTVEEVFQGLDHFE